MADLELIVVDDGSTDGTRELVAERAATDPRIVLVCNEENRGTVESLNRGLSLARGAFIARMDADDISLPTRLERQLAWMAERPSVGVCGTRVRPVWVGGEPDAANGMVRDVWPMVSEDAEVRCALLWSCQIAHPTVVIRRSAFPPGELRYDPEFAVAQDYELWARASEFTRLANVPEVLLELGVHARSTTVTRETDQARRRLAIHERLIHRLGIRPTEDDMKVHEALALGKMPATRVFVDRAEAWLLRLRDANMESRVFPEPEFSGVLAGHWYRTCRWATSLGPWVWRRYIQSSLRQRRGLPSGALFLAATLFRGRRGRA
jgi:glycosyltransferase involved in cell wall biosynthesis